MSKKHYMKQVYRFNIATKYSNSKINENSSRHCVHVLKRKEHCAVTSFHSDSRDLNFGISTWILRALDVCWYQCSTLAAPETPYSIKMHTEGYQSKVWISTFQPQQNLQLSTWLQNAQKARVRSWTYYSSQQPAKTVSLLIRNEW